MASNISRSCALIPTQRNLPKHWRRNVPDWQFIIVRMSMNFSADNITMVRILLVAFAPLQWGTVFWYLRSYERYPKNLLRRLAPWVFMMLANAAAPIEVYLLNARMMPADNIVKVTLVLEGLAFLGLLMFGLRKISRSKKTDTREVL
jgi:hypothetical protein